jgi:perosamine synthetase
MVADCLITGRANLECAGFGDIRIFGDFTDEPATADHGELVFLARKQEIGRWYDEHLVAIDEVETPFVPDYAVHSYQSYLITLRPRSSRRIDRDALLRQMAARGISCRHGIAPMHWEPYYRQLYPGLHLPITEEISQRTMFLPIYPSMTETELQYIVDNLKELLARREW